MPTAFEAIHTWIDEARTKLKDGGIQKGDLDRLHQIIKRKPGAHATMATLSPCRDAGHPLSGHRDGVARTGAGIGDGDCNGGARMAL